MTVVSKSFKGRTRFLPQDIIKYECTTIHHIAQNVKAGAEPKCPQRGSVFLECRAIVSKKAAGG